MKLPSVSQIEQEIRVFRGNIVKLRRADGVFGGTRGATCTVCLWVDNVDENEVFIGDVNAEEAQATCTGYGSEVVPRLGVAFDIKAAARRLREAAEKGTAAPIKGSDAARTG